MIKVFGKVRYHWQPEFYWSIIYWSFTLVTVFIGGSLLLEKTELTFTTLALFGLFILLVLLGFHRYFMLDEQVLYIASANLFKGQKIEVSKIFKVSVTYLSVKICTEDHPEGLSFYMRKWPKKYFVNTLALHPNFKGEVELLDHMIEQDYFEVYYSEQGKSIR